MAVSMNLNCDTVTAKIDGDIDHHTAGNIRKTIDVYIQDMHPKLLELDFGGVQFMDSSGIGLIMGRYKLMKLLNGQVSVINVPDHLKRIIDMSGLGVLGILK